MKITIAYTEEEGQEKDKLLGIIGAVYPAIKIRKSDRNPPFHHVYLTTKRPQAKQH